MKFSKTFLGFEARIGVVVALSLAAANAAQPSVLESLGARFGLSSGPPHEDFRQADVFVQRDLPWSWDLGAQWRLQSRAELSAGWLGNDHAHAGVFSLGPMLVLGRGGWPLNLDGGVSATALTRNDFRTENFGIPFQFTSHVGVTGDLSSRIRLGYRFHHMSNAGLGSHNPGLNMHLFSVSYRF